MKILLVVPYTGYSGVGSGIQSILAEQGHEIYVVGDFSKSQVLRSACSKIHYYRAKTVNIFIPGFLSNFPFFASFQSILDEIKPDIIHINCLPFLTTYQAAKNARKNHIPAVVHVHGVTAERGHMLNFFQWLFLQSIGKRIFKNSSKVICLTKNDARQVISFGCMESKIKIVSNGVDVSKFRCSAECASNGFILWFGRIVPEKGLLYLIKAISILSKSGRIKNYRFVIIGNGSSKSDIEALIRILHVEDIVEMIPGVPHDKIVDYLAQASIVVLPSLKEGMPYALLEAMSCGKAVVGSNISGIRDIIVHGENGLLVPPRCPEELANEISNLINDSDLRLKLGRNARNLMVAKYDWSMIVNRINTVYFEAINELCR